jgi:hypothetical protein
VKVTSSTWVMSALGSIAIAARRASASGGPSVMGRNALDAFRSRSTGCRIVRHSKIGGPMSEMGQKQTSIGAFSMSALGQEETYASITSSAMVSNLSRIVKPIAQRGNRVASERSQA